METIRLSHLNSSFRIEGKPARKSLELDKALVLKPTQPNADVKLKIVVYDEKDIPIYSNRLVPDQQHADTWVRINERFVFYDHLTVRVKAEPADSAFEAEVIFR
ncbi:hypothetical protein H9Q13_04745 [Pontibacter sp. JH31]|uniref:Uncharacterized protein n=1 Tax=Pontibacter aquaedesilientis TaxID=2766980 RepID=A0ABR7XFT9_9BACT|nr:hypothetical protein [Pontibacter aquaedesilientis]MBD1396463.1 hypothetical protein [Pontibacter aquaedesilientis]